MTANLGTTRGGAPAGAEGVSPAAVAALDHLEPDPGELACPVQERPAVAGIHPAVLKLREAATGILKQHGCAVTVADVGGGHAHA